MTSHEVPGRPSEGILAAHRATAYFLRLLAQLPADGFGAPADAHSPRSRRQIIAEVGHDARGYARVAEEVRAGIEAPKAFDTGADRDEAISLASTLPSRANGVTFPNRCGLTECR